jgi:lipopolysaccharide/colanic/teichoic acid biosynthesis glycosyltransferase
MRYVARYSPRQYSRLRVRPGVTGLAQIRGRNAVDWPERLELDARYVEAMGGGKALLVDAGILLATAFQVCIQAITGKGVSGPGVATMTEFLP